MMHLEIKEYHDPETDDVYDAIFVDGIVFDWGMDQNSLRQAKTLAESNPTLQQSINDNIQHHFVESFSEFLGREITLGEINEAIKSGVI